MPLQIGGFNGLGLVPYALRARTKDDQPVLASSEGAERADPTRGRGQRRIDSGNTPRAFKAIPGCRPAGYPSPRSFAFMRDVVPRARRNARVGKEVFGHSAITPTLGTDSHVLPALAAEAAAKLDTILRR